MNAIAGAVFYALIWALFISVGAAVGYTAIGAVIGSVACLALFVWTFS